MRVLLVGDHALLLQGLARLLEEECAADVRTVRDPSEAEEAIGTWRPEATLVETVDVLQSTDLLGRLHASAPDVPLVVIAPNNRTQFLAALRAHAQGFVGRDLGVGELLGTLNAVRRGEWGIGRAMVGDLAREYVTLAESQEVPAAVLLSEREQRVLALLAQGMSAHQMAETLFLSTSTIRADVRAITQKLGVTNRVQAVAEALRRGLVPTGDGS